MRKKEIVGCVSCSILHEDSLLFCMINRTITVGMIDNYYESLNYYFIARQKETVAHTRCSVRLHSLAKTLLSSRRHSLQTHTHTHTLMHIFFDLCLRASQGLHVATSPSLPADLKSK